MIAKFLEFDVDDESYFSSMIEDEPGTSISIPLPTELDNIMVEPIEGMS